MQIKQFRITHGSKNKSQEKFKKYFELNKIKKNNLFIVCGVQQKQYLEENL